MAILHPVAGKNSKVSEAQVRQTLRLAFQVSGLPEEVQTDGEPCLNPCPGDPFPSRFTLWLMGMGIAHLRSRPGVPTDDAEVERAHRTLYDFFLVDALQQDISRDELNRQLQNAVDQLNHCYPSRAHGCEAQPPFTAHPELSHPPRPFDPQYELAHFDLDRVDAYLAPLRFERKVGRTGQIKLGGREARYCVGRKYIGQTVKVRFDPTQREFVAYQPNAEGQEHEIRRWPAKRLTAEDIIGIAPKPVLPCPQQLPLPFLFEESNLKESSQV